MAWPWNDGHVVIRHVTPVGKRQATGRVARVYDDLRREFGIHAEPIVLHSPAPDLLAGAWMVCREVTVAAGAVERPVKEAVAVAVSELNRCPYCVDAHGAMLRSTGAAVPTRIEAWAAATRSRGAAILQNPPFDAAQVTEMVGTAVLFHYINRPVSVFLDESPLPTRRRPLHGPMLALAGRRFRPFTRVPPAPGESLDLLPDATLPPDMEWARGARHIEGAWARFAAAVEAAGEDALPSDVRAWLRERLGSWNGEDPPLGAAWVDDQLGELQAGERAAGRLALLSAFAPYRVDGGVVGDYRRAHGAGDARLVAAVVWAALAAARRVGSWLSQGRAVDLPAGRAS